MRVLMLCPQFRPLTGGYERSAERLAAAMAERGHDVLVLTERRDMAWPKHELQAGFRVRRLWCRYRRGWHSVTALTSLAAWLLCHGRRYEIWHAHQYGTHATLAILVGKLLRRPVLLKLTSSAGQGLAHTVGLLRMGWLHAWAYRNMTACLAVSEETVHEAADFGIPQARIHAIGNGVDTAQLQPADPARRAEARSRCGLGEGLVAVAVGRMAEEKNPLGLVDAWRKARAMLPADARLIWVGDGSMRQEVETRIRAEGLEDSFLLAGYSDAVPQWLAAADLFLLSSRNEGMANTLLEAMACGLPSVATAVSGTHQLLSATGAGKVVPIGDMAAFSEAIVELARAPDQRACMGAHAREVIVSNYSINAVTERMLVLYENILVQR